MALLTQPPSQGRLIKPTPVFDIREDRRNDWGPRTVILINFLYLIDAAIRSSNKTDIQQHGIIQYHVPYSHTLHPRESVLVDIGRTVKLARLH